MLARRVGAALIVAGMSCGLWAIGGCIVCQTFCKGVRGSGSRYCKMLPNGRCQEWGACKEGNRPPRGPSKGPILAVATLFFTVPSGGFGDLPVTVPGTSFEDVRARVAEHVGADVSGVALRSASLAVGTGDLPGAADTALAVGPVQFVFSATVQDHDAIRIRACHFTGGPGAIVDADMVVSAAETLLVPLDLEGQPFVLGLRCIAALSERDFEATGDALQAAFWESVWANVDEPAVAVTFSTAPGDCVQ